MRRVLLIAAVAGSTACVAPPHQPDPPASVSYPADEFPAPPGFRGEQLAPDTWRFTGIAKPQQIRLFYRVSCVEYYDWTTVHDRQRPDGTHELAFSRGDARLLVRVRPGPDVDSLRCHVTLERATDPP